MVNEHELSMEHKILHPSAHQSANRTAGVFNVSKPL